MVSKDFNQIIEEIKLEDAKAIKEKELQSFTFQHLQEQKEKLPEKKLDYIQDNINNEILTGIKTEEPKNEIKEEKKEEPKNEIKEEKKEEPKNEIKEEKKEEPKNEIKEIEIKEKKKKKKHHKHKSKKTEKIFDVPKINPYRNLFEFKEVSNSRFQDNSIFRVINNWEEKEWTQTTPPTKDIDELFPNQIFPQGEIQPYLK